MNDHVGHSTSALGAIEHASVTDVGAVGGKSRNLVLAAMIFAVAMTFIDQTIVSIAAPNIQRELRLSVPGCSGR